MYVKHAHRLWSLLKPSTTLFPKKLALTHIQCRDIHSTSWHIFNTFSIKTCLFHCTDSQPEHAHKYQCNSLENHRQSPLWFPCALALARMFRRQLITQTSPDSQSLLCFWALCWLCGFCCLATASQFRNGHSDLLRAVLCYQPTGRQVEQITLVASQLPHSGLGAQIQDQVSAPQRKWP